MSSPTESQNTQPAPDEELPGEGRSPRTTALILAGTGLLLVAVAAAAVLLLGGDDGTPDSGPVAQLRTSASPGTSTQSATGTVGAGGTSSGTPRNPFAGGTATTAGATAGATQSPAATGGVPTLTVTATPTGADAVYLGLYGFTQASAPQAMFRVNAGSYTVSAGSTFSSGFTYVKRTTEGCAQVKYGVSTHTLCTGDVVRVR